MSQSKQPRNKWQLSTLLARLIPCAMLLVIANTAYAVEPPPAFSLLGHLQTLSIDDLNDPLSSGSMTVNGIKVILPKNLLIKMPGQYLTLNDLFRGPHPGSASNHTLAPVKSVSGLALDDVPKPAVPFEVEVIGNMVDDTYIAGVVSLSQQGLNGGQGIIQAIDLDKGELLVGAAIGTATARVRINDFAGRYGKPNALKTGGSAFDDRFTSDSGNAPITANTGFPMCIPRSASDNDCPQSNRPAGSGGRFTCGVATIDPTAPAFSGCNPKLPAPFKEGDFITYAGMLTEDSPGSGKFFVAAHAINALLGIYTSPGKDPAYTFIEEAIVGTIGEPYPDIPQEETSRFRIVGFTTDPTRQVEVILPDIDGSERILTTLRPQTAGQIGRFRITLPAKANFLPVTRDVIARIKNHVPAKVAGGLDSGQYTAPVGEYIYPENTQFGKPMAPVSVPFENFCFLKKGGELLGTLGRDTLPNALRLVIGPLDRFPRSGHPNSQPRADGTSACD